MQMPDANFRSPSYYIAETEARCGSCGNRTRVLAVALPAPHEILIEDEWQSANTGAFLFHVSKLPEAVRRLLQTARLFRPARAEDPSDLSWENHCEHCGSLLSEEELHCEPGGFMPGDADAARAISLLEIRQDFQAVAAGYAADPEFFAHMRKR